MSLLFILIQLILLDIYVEMAPIANIETASGLHAWNGYQNGAFRQNASLFPKQKLPNQLRMANVAPLHKANFEHANIAIKANSVIPVSDQSAHKSDLDDLGREHLLAPQEQKAHSKPKRPEHEQPEPNGFKAYEHSNHNDFISTVHSDQNGFSLSDHSDQNELITEQRLIQEPSVVESDQSESTISDQSDTQEANDQSQKHELSLDVYLDHLFDHYKSYSAGVPAELIARIVSRMQNTIELFMIRNKLLEALPYPLSMRSFRVKTRFADSDGMDGNVLITLCAACKPEKVGLQEFRMMSPQQIKDLRLNTYNSDIEWFLGAFIHFMLYQTYPLDELVDKLGNNEHSEHLYMEKIRDRVKNMLDSDQEIPIRNDFAFLFNKQYKMICDIMKNALETLPEKREFRGGNLLKLAAGLVWN